MTHLLGEQGEMDIFRSTVISGFHSNHTRANGTGGTTELHSLGVERSKMTLYFTTINL